MKWVLFAIGAIVWIGVCWFFASMVALSDAGPKASIAQDACARQHMIADPALSRMDALYRPDCKAAHDRVLAEESRPTLRKGLLIGVLPVLLIGFFLYRRQ